MSEQKYKFIKSQERMRQELHHLWENEAVYAFVGGPNYIKKRELEICECLVDREYFIGITKSLWELRHI